MSTSASRTEHIIVAALAFLGLLWFFTAYSAQHPESMAQVSMEKGQVEQRAREVFTSLGYSLSEYTVERVHYRANDALLNALQEKVGRRAAIDSLGHGPMANLHPYYWDVIFERNVGNPRAASERRGGAWRDRDNQLHMQLDGSGQFIGFINQSEHLPVELVQRGALSAVFAPLADSLGAEPLTTVRDSLLRRLLYFDLQQSERSSDRYTRRSEEGVLARFNRNIPSRYSVDDAKALADYYLQDSGWMLAGLRSDTAFIKRIDNVNAANVRYATVEPVLQQHIQLDVVIAPTGALLQVQSSVNPDAPTDADSDFIWGAFYTLTIFLLGLAGLVIFFFRMRARTIDSHSAILTALIMGITVSVYIFLGNVGEVNPFSNATPFRNTLGLLMQMGVVGALASVGYFVLSSLADSIARQHWPGKLLTFDYVRRGMMRNKPVGRVLLRAVALTFVLGGIWTLLLGLFPGMELEFEDASSGLFLSWQAAWAPLYVLLRYTWYSFGMMLILFLCIGSHAYGYRNSRIVTAVVAAVACGVFLPVYSSFGPPLYTLAVGTLLGLVLAFIFIHWDFLTLLLAHFFFMCLLETAPGWMVQGSPDVFIFYLFAGLLIVSLGYGCIALYMGREEQSLSEYVPGYVEELAQEQRIKQELQIAREVQQSFLPARMPKVAGLDMAAVCKPAYETGGDYYDFIQLDEHRVAVAIGDVSGKGIQAAFYMTFVKGLLHSLCRETDSPAEVLKKTNRLFYANATNGRFISLVYGIIDSRKRTFTFARAGHNPILHLNTSTGAIRPLRPGGLGIGLTKDKLFDNKIEEMELSITGDDLFLLYTDGIVEAPDEKHQFFGDRKLQRLVEKHQANDAGTIVSAVAQNVESYIGKAKQHDDMTLMAIRFTNQTD